MCDPVYLKKMWDALGSPFAHQLLLVLGDVQKEGYPPGYSDWKDFVTDVMEAMELDDGGVFPAEWYPPEDADI